MFKTYQFGQASLPLVIEAEQGVGSTLDAQSLIALCAENKSFVESKLLEHGAVLFRGFSVESANALEQFARAESGEELLGYVDGTSPRTKVDAGVYTSTE